MNWKDFEKQRIETLSARWLELFNEGKRPSVIMDALQNETGLNKFTIYRIISVKELKKQAIEVNY